ncbi:MAG: hypothetical protein Q8Q56_03425, partial [Alphaproteobacteria bacterium]|nr:hypothetical protein [Alphaproteobacteria bacterium]
LLIFSLYNSVRGEAILHGDEAYFQITLAPEYRAIVSNQKKEGMVPKSEVEDQKLLIGAEKAYSDFIEARANDRIGMVIGRGNVQGIDEDRITIPELKGLSWLFLDPGNAGHGVYFRANEQDATQGNALATKWPVDFSIKESFDAVVFDYGTLQYIGDDGSETLLGREYFDKQMALVITKPDGTKLSQNSFKAPYIFRNWLLDNNPPEHAPLKSHYEPLIQAAKKRQRKILERGLIDAYLALKRGGMLIIPIDATVTGINFVNLLSISAADLVRKRIANGDLLTDSPVLPQLTRGMGTSYSDYYSIVKKSM